MKLIEIENLSYKKGDNSILSTINMRIYSNKIYTIIGPSGSGKSTLLQMFNRLLEPCAGKILYQAKDIQAINVLALRKDIGMVFQKPYLFPKRVVDNLTYACQIQGIDFTNELGAKSLKEVGLKPDLLFVDVERLSGGQQQRVSIARTLIGKPRVLLLDEPTSALDPSSTETIEQKILELKERESITGIWVTHNMEQAKRVSDYTFVLEKGRILEEGLTKELFSRPKNSRTFEFISGQLKEEL